MPRRLVFLASAVALATAGCPDDPPDGTGGAGGEGGTPNPCTVGFIGDMSLEPEIEAFYYGADDADHPLADGARPSLVEPPQGGRVLYIGARARNLDGCGVLVNATLRDPTTNQVRFDTRSANLIVDDDGWGSVRRKDFSVYSNVPACQNSWSDLSVHEDEYILEVKVTDREGRVAQASFSVRPECTEYSQARPPGLDVLNECNCICREGYMIGDTCQGDGGGGAGGGA